LSTSPIASRRLSTASLRADARHENHAQFIRHIPHSFDNGRIAAFSHIIPAVDKKSVSVQMSVSARKKRARSPKTALSLKGRRHELCGFSLFTNLTNPDLPQYSSMP
jgi:hypothetical protein